MRRANSEQTGKRVWLRRMIASAVVATLLVSLLSFTVFAQNRYVITDGDLVTAHNSFSRDPETVLKEVGIKLECRRQTSENGFYYVICGDTHRLFLMTDNAGIVKDVILSSGLPSKEAIEQQIETGKRIGWSLSRMGIPGTNGAEPNVLDGASSRYITYAVLLQDGAVTWKEDFQQDPAQIDYQFYSREAWERLETRPDYLILLPVDTAPWN